MIVNLSAIRTVVFQYMLETWNGSEVAETPMAASQTNLSLFSFPSPISAMLSQQSKKKVPTLAKHAQFNRNCEAYLLISGFHAVYNPRGYLYTSSHFCASNVSQNLCQRISLRTLSVVVNKTQDTDISRLSP